MVIEIDIYSGRPNPRFSLAAEDARSLIKLHQALARTPRPAPSPPGLGYRGFTYEISRARCRAYKGFVSLPNAVFADDQFSVEHFLVDRLPSSLAALREPIIAELRG